MDEDDKSTRMSPNDGPAESVSSHRAVNQGAKIIEMPVDERKDQERTWCSSALPVIKEAVALIQQQRKDDGFVLKMKLGAVPHKRDETFVEIAIEQVGKLEHHTVNLNHNLGTVVAYIEFQYGAYQRSWTEWPSKIEDLNVAIVEKLINGALDRKFI